jgi:hypothetical protein
LSSIDFARSLSARNPEPFANAVRRTDTEIYGYFDGQPVRRLLLEKSACHLYYLLLEKENIVRIVAVWGASRGTGPDLG